MPRPDPDYVDWLVSQSMLHHARTCAVRYAGHGRQWQRPYGESRPRAATAMASVWFTAYPASIVTRPGESVLKTLGDETLWHTLAGIGIHGIHTGPMKRAGGLNGREHTPTVDGNFDRISVEIDPAFGTKDEFVAMSRMAAAHNAIVIDDVVPAHTGKGADWHLATMAHGEYPGLYHMVEIRPEDWNLLPEVPEGRDAANIPPACVDQLRDKGYIVGELQRVIFLEPGVKDSNWSATGVVTGVDGTDRRWVYLHYFKEGQPALNWLDPTFAAPTMIVGDALHSIDVLGARGIRLDANGFLGVERQPSGGVLSEGHPLSVVGNQLVSGMLRKVGGFSFQELNLTLDDIAQMSSGGADLSYDFITRPAYHYALVTGDTEFLRLMLRETHRFGIDPASLIHALQNHDELTLELVHFWTKHESDRYRFQGREQRGIVLRDHVRNGMYEALSGEATPYNLRFTKNGVACTTASLIAAALRIPDLDALTGEQIARIRDIHLLLVMYNAFQPGVFALSGWDLVGALPLKPEQVADLMADGDTRWIERGAYDLIDIAPGATESASGLPKARSLYGSLPEQLRQPDSFASQLKRLLAVRADYNLAQARQVAIPDVTSPALLVMVHELMPAERGMQITALNFGATRVEETVVLTDVPPGPVVDMINGQVAGDLAESGELALTLEPYAGTSLRVVPVVPMMP